MRPVHRRPIVDQQNVAFAPNVMIDDLRPDHPLQPMGSTSVLLESVTDYCGRRSMREHGEPRVVRCEFSATGGLKLNDFRQYYRYIKYQAAMGIAFNKDFPLDWRVIDPEEMFIYRKRCARPTLR